MMSFRQLLSLLPPPSPPGLLPTVVRCSSEGLAPLGVSCPKSLSGVKIFHDSRGSSLGWCSGCQVATGCQGGSGRAGREVIQLGDLPAQEVIPSWWLLVASTSPWPGREELLPAPACTDCFLRPHLAPITFWPHVGGFCWGIPWGTEGAAASLHTSIGLAQRWQCHGKWVQDPELSQPSPWGCAGEVRAELLSPQTSLGALVHSKHL